MTDIGIVSEFYGKEGSAFYKLIKLGQVVASPRQGLQFSIQMAKSGSVCTLSFNSPITYVDIKISGFNRSTQSL